jgi:hypothetical protein
VLPAVVPGEIDPPSVMPPATVELELGLDSVVRATVELLAPDPMLEVLGLPAVLPPPIVLLGAIVEELMVLLDIAALVAALVDGRTQGEVIVPEMPVPTAVCASAKPAGASTASKARDFRIVFTLAP